MTGLIRGTLARRLFALGILQLALAIATAFVIGALTRPPRPPHFPPPGGGPGFDPMPGFLDHPPPGPPPPGPHPHHLLDPGLYPPVLTFLCGLVIVGLGAWLTAGWFRRLLLAEKELLVNVSHELRTPLARIRVALDLAAEGNAERAQASLSEIATDLGELEALVEDVLTAARFELAAGGSPGVLGLHREHIEAAALAARAAQHFRTQYPGRALELRGATEPGTAGPDVAGPWIKVDPMLMRRVLDNLLENAHKYSPDPRSPISLEVRPEGASCVFEVQDRGLGIPAADLPHVFSPFFRGERSRDRRSGGVGLGLTLARRIVEAHGGRISITSQPGHGTAVRVTLPISP